MLAVALALVLLIVGGIALFGALTSGSKHSGSGASPKAGKATGTSRSTAKISKTSKATTQHTLALKVTGGPTRVYVATSGGNAQVLLDQVLSSGDVQYFDQAPLDVVVVDGSAVDVYIYGQKKPKGKAGQRLQWHVSKI